VTMLNVETVLKRKQIDQKKKSAGKLDKAASLPLFAFSGNFLFFVYPHVNVFPSLFFFSVFLSPFSFALPLLRAFLAVLCFARIRSFSFFVSLFFVF